MALPGVSVGSAWDGISGGGSLALPPVTPCHCIIGPCMSVAHPASPPPPPPPPPRLLFFPSCAAAGPAVHRGHAPHAGRQPGGSAERPRPAAAAALACQVRQHGAEEGPGRQQKRRGRAKAGRDEAVVGRRRWMGQRRGVVSPLSSTRLTDHTLPPLSVSRCDVQGCPDRGRRGGGSGPSAHAVGRPAQRPQAAVRSVARPWRTSYLMSPSRWPLPAAPPTVPPLPTRFARFHPLAPIVQQRPADRGPSCFGVRLGFGADAGTGRGGTLRGGVQPRVCRCAACGGSARGSSTSRSGARSSGCRQRGQGGLGCRAA